MSVPRIINAAFLAPAESIQYVYGQGRSWQVAQRANLLPGFVCAECLEASLHRLGGVEVFFSTWGMPRLTGAHLDRLPSLRAVFYAAGSVKSFATPLLERGILITSAWKANAIPVAEFTLAQILLSCKGYWHNVSEYSGTSESRGGTFSLPQSAHRHLGNYKNTVALLGAGAIGRHLIGLLRHFSLRVTVFDPFLSAEEADRLGVRKVSLEEAFSQGYVVSNHLADTPDTEGMIIGSLLARLRPGSVFINTGRGRTVRQAEMADILRERPDVTALLDVTDPEPLPPSSPLRSLPNVHISSHIAGAVGEEVLRMADMAIAEFERYRRNEPLQDMVTLEMLPSLA